MIQFITHANERYDYLDGVRMHLKEDADGFNFE